MVKLSPPTTVCGRLIVIKEGQGLGDQKLHFCGQRGRRPQISFRSAQLETIQALVLAGLRLSLTPAMAVLKQREQLPNYRSLQSPKTERKLVAVWPKQRPPDRSASEFLKMISERFGKQKR